MSRMAIAATFLALFVLGLLLRLDSIAASLWIDEFGTFWVAEPDLAAMLRRCWEFQGQSPLYYALPWASIHLLGESEIALRLPSLVLGGLSVAVIAACAHTFGGAKAAWYAAALFWLSGPAVEYGVAARPYGLVLFTVALAIAGFVMAVRRGDRGARMLWIVGGASVAWAHYVHYPIVIGLAVAYATVPTLRLRYPVRRFFADAVAQGALVGLCVPQILALFARRSALAWIDQFNYGAFIEPLAAFAPAVLIVHGRRARLGNVEHDEPSITRGLLICILFHIAVLEAAAMLGVNLLHGRYFVSAVVPAVLLASVALARARRGEAVVVVAAFAIITGAGLLATKSVTGTFSGIGYEDWRGAVADLSTRIRGQRDPLVFYRSGFVEEDAAPLGAPPQTTLAPLRSPGRSGLAVRVRPLNFRWSHAGREDYFARAVAPAIDMSAHFFVVGLPANAGISYFNEFVAWVEAQWPGRFRVDRTRHGAVEVIEFQESTDPDANP